MVDTLFESFNVTVKHGASAATTHSVPGPMNIEPFVGGFFATANTVSHFRIKDFCAATGNGTQSGSAKKLERFRDRHFENPLSEMAHFNRSKSFDVQIRIESAQSAQEIEVPVLFQGWVQAADHMDFSNSKRQRFRHSLNYLAGYMLERVSVPFLGRKRAKLTR